MYALWEKAYEAASQGRSYTISSGGSSRTYTRQDIAVIKHEMLYWERKIKEISGVLSRVKFITPAF